MYKAVIMVYPNERDKLRKVCEDIKKKDSMFSYNISDEYGILISNSAEKFECALEIFDEDKESLQKRAGWMIHKMKDAKVSDFFYLRKIKNIRLSGDE